MLKIGMIGAGFVAGFHESRTSMVKQDRGSKPPAFKLEVRGTIPEAVSDVFKALKGLICKVCGYLWLKIDIKEHRLRQSRKKK